MHVIDENNNAKIITSRREFYGWLSVFIASLGIALGWVWDITSNVQAEILSTRSRTDEIVDRTADKLEEIHSEVNEVRVDVKGLQTDMMNMQQTLNRIDSKLQ